MQRLFLIVLCLLGLSLSAKQPNIVLVLIDDMGWSGSSVQIDPEVPASKGSIFDTPNLERLAQSGMTFTNAYAPGPMCTPSRVGILTGKTPAEIGITSPGGGRAKDYNRLAISPQPRSLDTEIDSLAKSLQSAGYATAHLGKWHIGRTGPEHYGYSVHDGLTANEVPNSSPDNPKDIFGITERACQFIEAQSAAKRPFYVQLSHYAVHSPTETRDASRERFKNVRSTQRDDAAGRAAMAYDLDDSIGLLRAKIRSLGLSNNTYLIVMSDNGGNGSGPRRNTTSALNAGKGSLHESGIRVPFFAEGPGIAAGSLSRESITGCDLYPTFCDWAGIPIPTDLEGVSLAPLLARSSHQLAERPLLFHFPHYGQGPRQKPQSALILGDYKLLYDWESEQAQLFNLNDDLGEQTDLAASEPDKARSMLTLLMQRLDDTGARIPEPNPNYDPTAEAPSGGKKRK